MRKVYKSPVMIPVYIGSDEGAEKLRENLIDFADKNNLSLSALIVDLMKRAEPKLFKGVENNGK